MSTNHAQNAKEFVANDERMHWHDQALWFVREKRDLASKSIPEWENLREFAAQIKSHTMANLDKYLDLCLECDCDLPIRDNLILALAVAIHRKEI